MNLSHMNLNQVNVLPISQKADNNSLLVVCGEVSSDEHTAPIISYIKSYYPELDIYGMGSVNLKNAGMELLVDAKESASVMGLTEVFNKISKLVSAFNLILREVDKRKTKTVLLVDFPDFNLRLAKKLKKKGLKVFYFISPQLWAWRQGRIESIKKYVDQVFPIFPFEEDFYKNHGVDASFVGHPFLQREVSKFIKEDFISKFNLPENKKLIALLPGSRRSEVKELFPVFLETIKQNQSENHHFIVPVANGVSEIIDSFEMPKELTLISGHAKEILGIVDAAVVASGTATVEAALSRVPFCIVYKVSTFTYLVGKLLIKGVKFIGMPNLIYGNLLLKEFIQKECNSKNIQQELNKLLYENNYREKILDGLDIIRNRLEKDSEEPFYKIVGDSLLEVFNR